MGYNETFVYRRVRLRIPGSSSRDAMNPYEVTGQFPTPSHCKYTRSVGYCIECTIRIVSCMLFGYCGPLLLFLPICGVLGGWEVVLQNLNQFHTLHSQISLNSIIGLAPNAASLIFFVGSIWPKVGVIHFRCPWTLLWSSTVVGFSVGIPIAALLGRDTFTHSIAISTVALLTPLFVFVCHRLIDFNRSKETANPVPSPFNIG